MSLSASVFSFPNLSLSPSEGPVSLSSGRTLSKEHTGATPRLECCPAGLSVSPVASKLMYVPACSPPRNPLEGGRESSTAPKQRQTVHSASNPRTSCWRHVSAFLGRLEFGAGALCGGWKPWFWSLYGHSAPNTALRAPSRCVIAALSWERCDCAAGARLLSNFGPTSPT